MTPYMKKLIAPVLFLLVAVNPAFSQPEDETVSNIFYDIYVEDSCLSVWVDLSPFLTSRVVERLRDGIDLAIECRAELSRPRSFWSDETVISQARTVELSRRSITNEYVLTSSGQNRLSLSFSTLDDLNRHLSDSFSVCLEKISELDPDGRFVVRLRVTTISLTDLNLAKSPADSSDSESPLRYLFRQFLRLTEYGRHEVGARTRPFSLNELEEID